MADIQLSPCELRCIEALEAVKRWKGVKFRGCTSWDVWCNVNYAARQSGTREYALATVRRALYTLQTVDRVRTTWPGGWSYAMYWPEVEGS